jgi:hypothetical protein
VVFLGMIKMLKINTLPLARTMNNRKSHLQCSVLPSFQIVVHLTPSLTTRLIQKFVQIITFFLLWFALSIQDLQEWLKFGNVCTNFLNKPSGQT